MDNRERLAMNLYRLREAKRFTQQCVADGAGISRRQYSKIEKGEVEPRARTLQGIATALGVSTKEVVAQPLSLSNVRFRSSKALSKREKRHRESIVLNAARWLRNYNALEEALGEKTKGFFSDMVTKVGAMQGASRPFQAAHALREALGLGVGDPIRDICGLLVKAGAKVLTIKSDLDTFFGLSISERDGSPAIVVNVRDDISVERRIFTVAHELGHLLLHPFEYRIDQTEAPEEHEKDADLFASYFLMPPVGFEKEWMHAGGLGFLERVLHVKRLFRVSYRTVLYRLVELGRVDKSVWSKFCVMYKKKYRKSMIRYHEPDRIDHDERLGSYVEGTRSQEPESLSEIDFMEDRLDLLVRRGIERDIITASKGAEILGLTLGEIRERMASWEWDQ